MHPFIQDGDFVTVSPVESSSVRIGDVVFYSTAENNGIIHRVINKYGKNGNMNLAIKGDASFSSPEKVDIQNVLGKVVAIERNGHRIKTEEGLAKLINFIYFRLSFIIKIAIFLSKIPSLFNPDLFIKKSADSLHSVAEKYNSAEEVEFHSQLISEGLEEWERNIIERYMKPEAKLLDVGCGAGREAIALVKMGFEVMGIDISPNMVAKATENAKKEGLNINFKVQSVTDIDCPAKYFDYVLFSREIYSYIPTKKLRIETLRKIRDILKPDGILLFSAYYKDRRLFSRLNIMGFFRRIRNFFLKEKFDSESGDLMVRYVSSVSNPKKLCFCHFFFGPKEILEEVRMAGLKTMEGENSGVWVVKP